MEHHKIAVLGLGGSLNEFNPDNFDMSVGVNDIWRYHRCEAVVCLDRRQNFTADRMGVIDECRPFDFYSHLACYKERPDFRPIEILSSYPDVTCDVTLRQFQRSFCSPFVAVQIAYRYYNAAEIHIFGVDLLNHPKLNNDLCDKIKRHFINLKKALDGKCTLIVHGDGILKNI